MCNNDLNKTSHSTSSNGGTSCTASTTSAIVTTSAINNTNENTTATSTSTTVVDHNNNSNTKICVSLNYESASSTMNTCSPHPRNRFALKCILYPSSYFQNTKSTISSSSNTNNNPKSSNHSLSFISTMMRITFAFLCIITSVTMMITYANDISIMDDWNAWGRGGLSGGSGGGGGGFDFTSLSFLEGRFQKLESIYNTSWIIDKSTSFLVDFELSKFLSSLLLGTNTTSTTTTTAPNNDVDADTSTSIGSCSIEEGNEGQSQKSCLNNDIFYLNESDYILLLDVTSQVGTYNPLPPPPSPPKLQSDNDNNNNNDKNRIMIKKPNRFIPILEARGTPDRDIDKDQYGHRRDTMPIANAIDQYIQQQQQPDNNNINTQNNTPVHSAVFQFLEEENGTNQHAIQSNIALKKYLKEMAHGIIVRNNPGTLSPLSQKKCDDMLRELSHVGVKVLTHPDVMSTLGAKDVSFFFF